MNFYDALKYLLTTSGGSKISRKSWSSNKYITKTTIPVTLGDKKTNIQSLDFVEILGGVKHTCTFHANPEVMLSNDWYIVTENNTGV